MDNRASFIGTVGNAIDRMIEVLSFVSSMLLILLTLVVFFEVLCRYIFNFPFVFTSELAGTLFPWIAFLMIIEITKNEEHIAITFLRDSFPDKMQNLSLITTKLIMMYFSFLMFKSSIELSSTVAVQKLPVIQISKSWLYASVSVAFAGVMLVLLYQLWLIIDNIKQKG